MSLKRARYIHCVLAGAVTNGFSAEIAPMDDGINNQACNFRITVCNPKDQFSRPQARAELAQKPWQEVRVVDLPRLLAETYFKAVTGIKLSKVEDKKQVQQYQNEWAWVWKYFL